MAKPETNEEGTSFADEIEDMIGKVGSTQTEETEEEEESEESEETEEEDSTDEESEEGEEDTEEEEEEEESEDESGEEESGEEAEEDEEEDDQDVLIRQLNELASGKLTVDDEEEQLPQQQQQEEEEQPSQQKQQSTEFNLLEGEDFDQVVSNPDAFSKVMEKGFNYAKQEITQDILKNVVGIVTHQVQQHYALRELTNKFWAENGDLEPLKPYVAKVASVIQSKEPNTPIEKIFEKTAALVRKKLNLKTKGGGGSPNKNSRKPGKKPALVGGKKGTRKVQKNEKRSKLEKEISDILDLD